MRALALWLLVGATPFALPLVSCKSGDGGASDAAAPPAPSDSAPHTYGDLTDVELRDAVVRERVIAMVRPQSSVREDLGTKNEATRYELMLLKPLLGSPPSNAVRHGEGAPLVIGRAYVVIVDRHAYRELVRAVEVPEDKLRDVAQNLADRLVKAVAAAASAQASADGSSGDAGGAGDAGDAGGDTGPKASASAEPSTSAKPTAKPSTSTKQ